MSGIYIKGAKMPTEYTGRMFIRIWPDGIADIQYEGAVGGWDTQAIELPDHGDLIDRDEIRKSIRESIQSCKGWRNEIDEGREDYAEMMARIDQTETTFVECSLRLKNAPVVIPAERSEDETELRRCSRYR